MNRKRLGVTGSEHKKHFWKRISQEDLKISFSHVSVFISDFLEHLAVLLCFLQQFRANVN